MPEQRKLAAIMFTDIAGYSAMMSKDEKLAMDLLEKNRSIHKSAIAKFNGEYIKEVGDGTLAIFDSSLNAVSCALEIQKECSKEISLKVRIGIHIGDILVSEYDVFGDGVNIASRIEATGEPGGIYISEKVFDDVKNKSEIKSEFIGEKMLKNIDHPVKIYSIDADASTPVHQYSSLQSERISPTKVHHPAQKTRIRKTWLFIGLGAMILAIAAILVFVLPKTESVTNQNRIVVAIFENRTGDASLDELGTMAADWITQGLSQAVDADVVPTSTVMQLFGSFFTTPGEKQQSNYLEKLADMTKAGIMVSGMYYLQQQILQFQIEIKTVKDGRIIYAFPAITGSVHEPMELIEKLSSEIIGGVAYHLRLQNMRYVSKPPNKEAYSEYLAGMELFGKDYKNAIRHFIQASKKDSLFLQPQFYIAGSYSNQGDYFRADSVFRIISRNRERLTPYEGHFLDWTATILDGNYTEGLRHLLLAENISPGDISLNFLIGSFALYLNKPGITVKTYSKLETPDFHYGSLIRDVWRLDVLANALHLLGEYNQELVQARRGQQYYPDWFRFYLGEVRALSAMGRTEEIKMVIERCSSLSPQTGTVGDVIITAALELRAHGYVSEGQEYALQAVEWYRNRPASMDVREDLASALYAAGNWQDAQTIFDQLADEFPDNIDYLGFLGILAARMGDIDQAVYISDSLKRIDRPYLFGQNTYWRARIAAQLGKPKQAVEMLQESFAQGTRFGTYLHCVIDFEPLKDYPPYQELMKPKD